MYLIVASGGTPIGSEVDFATGYLRHIFNFIGIRDVRLIEAGQLTSNSVSAISRAHKQINGAVGLAV